MQKTYDFNTLFDALGERGICLAIFAEGTRATVSRFLAAIGPDGKRLDRVLILPNWSWDDGAAALAARLGCLDG